MTQESQPQKPGWFELVDGDAQSAQVTKVNKTLPAIAVFVTGAVIATGAFFANASENTQSSNQSSLASVAAVGNSTATQTADPTSATTPATTVGISAPGTEKIQDPSLGGMVKPGHDDDEYGDEGDDDEYGDGPNHDGDDHEGREHHDRGERA